MNRARRAENEVPVAFFASLTQHLGSLGENQSIPFDRVLTNIGNAYHSTSGIFIAPVTGIYVLSLTMLSFGDAQASYRLLMNGSVVVPIYHQPATGGYDSASATVVLQLAQGDDVRVANNIVNNHVHGNNLSFFAGFLLQETYDDSISVVGK